MSSQKVNGLCIGFILRKVIPVVQFTLEERSKTSYEIQGATVGATDTGTREKITNDQAVSGANRKYPSPPNKKRSLLAPFLVWCYSTIPSRYRKNV